MLGMLGSRKRQRTMEERLLGGGAEGGGEKVGRLDLDAPPPPPSTASGDGAEGGIAHLRVATRCATRGTCLCRIFKKVAF